MKLLLDENLPVKLKFRFLDEGLDAYTVADKNWNSKQNGELLELMIKERFSHLITFDNSISFQQNFLKYPVRVVIIVAPSNDYATIMEIFQDLVVSINNSFVGPNVIIHPSKNR